MAAEVVSTGIAVPEGPVWMPDGRLACTSVAAGECWEITVASGSRRLLADLQGGPNGLVLASDGSLVVAQNGGYDFSPTMPDVPYRPVRPSLQWLSVTGTVTTLADGGLQAPNDIAVTRDGTIVFTDPPPYPPAADGLGRVWAYSSSGGLRLVAKDLWFPNGIQVDAEGRIIVVEREGLARVADDGRLDWIARTLPSGRGDGLCIDENGRFYVASTQGPFIDVIDEDGALDRLVTGGASRLTNCCFGGADGRSLFVTETSGRVLVFEQMPTAGLPLFSWPVP